jgi:hypothetical protein
MASTTPLFSALPTTSARTEAGVTHIDLNFASAMSKGSGSIFVTDGSVQTVIDRATGQPTLRVVGATFTKLIALDEVSISGTHVMFDAAGLPANASLNVYMGAGTLQSGGKAAGAITVPGSAAFTTPAAGAPGLNATIEMDGSSLRSGQEITVTITFDKAVSELPANAIAAGNATINTLASSEDGKTWFITLAGQAATDAPSNVLRLNMEAVAATDGSRGAGVKESPSYLVDTIVAAHVGPQILMVADEGPYYDDGVSNDDTMAVTGLLYGTLKEGEHFELVINGRTIDPASIRIEPNPFASGQYYWSYNNDGEHFDIGANSVQARIVGAGGHASLTATKDILVEQDAPDIVSSPTGLVDAGKSISISFDEAMYWDDNVEVTQDVRVVDDLGNTSWINLGEDNLSADRKTLTFNAAEHDLATGNTYRIYLPEGLTDLAGNGYAGPAIGFTTAGPYQDKAPPRLVQAYIAEGSGIYGKDDVLEFRLRYSERINLDAGTETDLVLYLHNGNVARYAGLSDDRKELIFTYTIEAGDDVEALVDVDYSSSLLGHVRDDAGNIFRHAHVEYDGLTTEDGYGAVVSIDTVVAKPGAPQLHAASDTGTVGDNSTTVTAPRLTGSGAEAYARIAIYGGDVQIGSAVADASGHWDTVVSTALGAGTHQIRVIQEDRAGNVSEASAALDLSITAAPPTGLAAPVLEPLSDSGVSDSDGLTNVSTPTITGMGPANTTLTLMLDGADLGTVTTDAAGNWSYLPTAPLADGLHSFSVRQGSGSASPALSITVDRTKPMLAASPDGAGALNPAADIVIGFSEAVHITASEGEDDMLVLRDADGNLRRIAVSDANLSADKRSLSISASELGLLGLKDYHIQLPATLADLAGNAMDEYEIAFRTGADGLPAVTRVIVDSDHYVRAGESISFRVRFNESVERVGASEMWLGLNNGARAVFSGISGNEASFTYTVAANEDQEHLAITDTSTLVGHIADLSGKLLDAAHIVFDGLYDGSGYGTWVDIDTIAPERPNAPQLDPDSNTGSLDDLLTGERRPSITGSGVQRWARVELYEGDTLLGYSYADEDGNWEVRVESGKELADGVHNLSARQVDDAGNRGLASLPLAVTIDATVAALAAPRLKDGHDTGKSAVDNITREDEPILVGSGAEAFAKIKILSGETVVGFGSANASGNWSATLIDGLELDDGVYHFSARQEDSAGNLSAASPELVFTVDRTPPNPPGTASLVSASDSGALGDALTNVRTPTLAGSGADANAELVLYVDGREVGRPLANGSGNWTYAIPAGEALSDGVHSIQLRQLDTAGNESALSDAFDLSIDGSVAAPGRPVLAAASDSGSSNSDGITNVVAPSFSGSGAEAGATIVLYADNREIGRKLADGSGNWNLTVLEADKFTTNGSYAITAKQIDKAGNTSLASDAFSLVIDTSGPMVSLSRVNLALREFQLAFNEEIVFRPSGQFNLLESSSTKLSFLGNNTASWYLSNGAGGEDSILNFKISLSGLYNLSMANDAVQDVAGNNVQIVGSPQWVVDLLGPSA